MTGPGPEHADLSDDGAWFRVEPNGANGVVRRSVARLAEEIGLPPARAADSAIVVAEVISNLEKHADEGMVLVRAAREGRVAGIELIALDRGPGMADVRRSARDGHSTAGTLGIGLGAIARLATWCDMYSHPGQGTALVVQVWPGPPGSTWVAGVSRPLPGEQVCGDGHAARVLDRPDRAGAARRQVMVCDGLGHGPLASAAAQAAVNAFHAAPPGGPVDVMEHLHRELRSTRGAAVAVAELDADAGVVRYCGLGNIAGAVVADPAGGTVTTRATNVQRMVSLPGIAGHQRRQLRAYEYRLPPDGVVVLHSDGVRDRWQPADYPGLLDRSPHLVAAVLLRDAGLRRDDACVLAARTPS
jgi:anti-sigma regulatory factor (Ser/Thr protein kinase)